MPTSEHLHLALNHIPILGMPFAGLVVAWGLLRGHRETMRLGLILVVLCAAFTPVVMMTGERAADNYDGAAFVDSDGFAWMTSHGERAEAAAYAAYASGAVALLAFVAGFFRDKLARGLAVLAVLGAFATAGLSVRVADAGGKIRRPDFREKPARAEAPSLSPPESQ